MLKSLASTGAKLHAMPFGILAEMPFGLLDLEVSSAIRRSNTSSSVQRISSGQLVGSREAISSSESGGGTELKQLWKYEFKTSDFFLSSVTVSLLCSSVGIRDILFPLRALFAAQNCLGFLALATLLTFLALRNSWATLFLSCLFLDWSSPVLLYLLYALE